MSRCTIRSEWSNYGLLLAALAAAVCLPSGLNRADVEIAAIGGPIGLHTSLSADQSPEPTTPDVDSEALSPLVCFVGGTSNRAPETKTSAPAETTPADESKPQQENADIIPPESASPKKELSPELSALRDKIRKVLAMYYTRNQNARNNNCWEVMHAIIAYGVDTEIFQSGPGSEKVNAIGWLCFNRPCAGESMLYVNGDKLEARRGPGVQGHYGQFLAILAQSHLMANYPVQVGGKSFTLADLIEHEKANCFAGEELTFKLIALVHYLDSDETWKNRDGQEWSIQKLIQEELKQPIRGAACGGTHRLMGFSYAVNKRTQRGKPIVGEFRRAQIFTQEYHRYTLGLQNPDGSFSTEWFTRRGDNPDIDRRLKTSGHILEWIGYSLSDEELRDPRMIKATDYLATILLSHDKHTWEIGPLGHGLHALAIYDRRVFKPFDTTRPQTIVDGPSLEGAYEARQSATIVVE